MHASLVEKDTREDVLLIKDTRSKEDMHLFKDNRTKATTGSSVSSLYPLKDIEGNGQESGFFVFPDLSVRMEGTYRLKFCLYEMVGYVIIARHYDVLSCLIRRHPNRLSVSFSSGMFQKIGIDTELFLYPDDH